MGNWFAYAMLALWPMVTVWLFRTRPAAEAVFWSILGGHLTLPVKTAVDLPMIPPFDKVTIPAICSYLGYRFIAGKSTPILGRTKIVRLLLMLFIVSPFITAELNGDTIYVGGRVLPGMTHYDALSAVINQFIVIMPFFLGRHLYRTYEGQLSLFKMLAFAGLCYSLPILFEVRMSPQLHTWIYGYFPHSFEQMMRYGGFRPVVFIGHGLLVSFFVTVALISATILWQLKQKVRRFPGKGAAFYLMFVLLLCKSAGAFVYGFFAFTLLKIIKIKNQMRIAILLVSLALLYPNMSILNIFPHQAFLDTVASIEADRSRSMQVRFDNERNLLAHVRDRSYFGWGSWGRNRVYNEDTGQDETITDGRWIITYSQFGWLGFIVEFGLLCFPVFMSFKASKTLKTHQQSILLAAHALLISLVIVDQLPNASLAPWLWLLTGALLGRSEEILAQHKTVPKTAI